MLAMCVSRGMRRWGTWSLRLGLWCGLGTHHHSGLLLLLLSCGLLCLQLLQRHVLRRP